MQSEADSLVDLVYEAVLDPTRWNDFAERLSDTMGATSAVLFRMATEHCGPEFFGFGMTEIELQGLSDYQAYYHRVDDLAISIEKNSLRFGDCVTARSNLGLDGLHRSEWYNDFLLKYGYAHAGGLIMSEKAEGQGQRLAFTGLRARSNDDFEEFDFTVCRYLAPHINRAVRISEKLASVEAARLATQLSLHSLAFGVVLLDAKGQAQFVNEAAAAMFADKDGITLIQKRLGTATIAECSQIERAIRCATSAPQTNHVPRACNLSVSRPSGKQAYQVVLLPVGNATDGIVSPDTKVIAFLFDSTISSGNWSKLLMTSYGLTRSEARLALDLFDGVSVKEYAETYAITENTARWTLKQIFSKLEVRSQSDLVRFLASGPIGQLRCRKTGPQC